jgi:hypothetical protein
MGTTKSPKPNPKHPHAKGGVKHRGGQKKAKVATGLPGWGFADLLDWSIVEYDSDTFLLAAVVYGEASTQNNYFEMAAIANVIVRQSKARNATLSKLLGPHSTFAFAASDSNHRTAAFRKAAKLQGASDPAMTFALMAAANAIRGGTDYSNGAYFWDGADLKSNYMHHPKVKQGIKFTNPKHNIYGIQETSVNVTIFWQIPAKGGGTVNGKERGSYTYVYESTTAFGGTVFWKYGNDFLKATGNKIYE